jgi:hypothetical protein
MVALAALAYLAALAVSLAASGTAQSAPKMPGIKKSDSAKNAQPPTPN